MSNIERIIANNLQDELDNNKILILTGPRQAGKTTLLKSLVERLEKNKEQVYFYNFDRQADLDFFKKQHKIEAFLKIKSAKKKLYIFIDEVQRMKNAGTYFKYFYDEEINAKFIFSGSSSIEITDSFGDALTGRKRMYQLYPLSFQEIAREHLGEELELVSIGEPQASGQAQNILEELLVWGGYPELTDYIDEPDKTKALGELYESYVQKDVKDLLRVKNISGFNNMVKYLAFHVTEPVVVEDLVRATSLHNKTVNSYLDILEGTMIMGKTENYNPEYSEKLPKSKRYYFIDNGMRNYAFQQLQSGYRPDLRTLAINLVYSELLKLTTYNYQNLNYTLNHYDTYSDNYIEFIVSPKTSEEITAITLTYPEDRDKLGKKVHEFLNSHQPKKLVVLGKEKNSAEKVKQTQVVFKPLQHFLAEPSELLV